MLTVHVKSSLKIDPSRTTMLRRKFVADMQRRFVKLGRDIYTLIVTNDVFGLEDPVHLKVNRQEFKFQTDAGKVTSYQKWLQGEINTGILTVDGVGEPWTNKYVGASYKKGVNRAYTDVSRVKGFTAETDRGSFTQTAFGQPELQSKIELIYTRTYNELKGVTDAMSQQMSRSLANGLAAGQGSKEIARELRKIDEKITKTRALVIARTETIHAHAEGQLDSFENLGIEKVDIMAEILTAGDERVCTICLDAAFQGAMPIEEARGIIPLHPNCRCAWKPVIDTKQVSKGAPTLESVQSLADKDVIYKEWLAAGSKADEAMIKNSAVRFTSLKKTIIQ